MKKLINDVDSLLAESLDGFAAAHADIVTLGAERQFVRRRHLKPGKIALISGGGSGHEPLHAGFVGHGMLDAACPGQVFTSPTPDQMLAAAQAVDTGAGVLFIVKNYSGDMRDGAAARVPFVGSTPGSGGSRSYYVGDDVYGLQYIYGVAPAYRNLFASSQLLRNNVLINTASDPGNGDSPYTGVVAKCPGDALAFYVSAGNTGTQSETVQMRIYADDPVNGYGGAVPGTPLQTRSNVTIARYSALAFPVTVTIPASIPRDTNLSVFVEVDSGNDVNERKEYDNRARSALTLRVGNVATCGR